MLHIGEDVTLLSVFMQLNNQCKAQQIINSSSMKEPGFGGLIELLYGANRYAFLGISMQNGTRTWETIQNVTKFHLQVAHTCQHLLV